MTQSAIGSGYDPARGGIVIRTPTEEIETTDQKREEGGTTGTGDSG